MRKILRLLFPPRCAFCRKITDISEEYEICNDCMADLPFISLVEAEIYYSSYFKSVIGLLRYEGKVKISLRDYKFHDKPSYIRAYGELLYRRLLLLIDFETVDLVMSIPLHRKKEIERGYNQALLLSSFIARKTGIKEGSACISRIKNTNSQSKLAKAERIKNIKGAFKVIKPAALKNKSILLIDDILTTGSTIDECARVIKEAGARSITGAVIATGKGAFH